MATGKKTSEEAVRVAADLTGDELVRIAYAGQNYATTMADFYQFIVLSNAVISITNSTFSSLQSAGLLTPMSWYYITDLRVYAFALTGRIVSQDGIAEKDVPYNSVNYGGVDLWNNGSNYAEADVVVYGEFVYSANGAIAPSTIVPPDDPMNWTLQTGDSVYYRIEYLKCRIVKPNSLSGFGVDFYHDQYGNQLSDITFASYNTQNNIVDKYSYIYLFGGAKAFFFDNQLFYNSAIVVNNQSYGSVGGNRLCNSGVYCVGEWFRNFQNNDLRNIDIEFPTGASSNSDFMNCKIHFDDRTAQYLNVRLNADYLNGDISLKGSNLVDQLDAGTCVSGGVLNLNDNGANDLFGVYEIVAGDISISKITGYPAANYEKIILRPFSGQFIDLTLQDASGITSNGELVDARSGGGLITLDGSLGQYAIIEKSLNQGFDVFKVTLSL